VLLSRVRSANCAPAPCKSYQASFFERGSAWLFASGWMPQPCTTKLETMKVSAFRNPLRCQSARPTNDALTPILSDINIPEMSGLEFLPKAKAMRPDVPVIMITAYGDAETKRLGAVLQRLTPHKRSPSTSIASSAVKKMPY
jgi:CheY-like chemotaxis protein